MVPTFLFDDNGILFVGNIGAGCFADVIVNGQIRADRNIVPGHKPKSGDVDLHIVMKEAALVPRGIIWSSFDHCAARVNRHRVGKNTVRPVDRLDNIHLRQMREGL